MRRKTPKSYNVGMIVLLFLCAMYIVVYPAFQKQESEQNEAAESGIVEEFSDSENEVESSDVAEDNIADGEETAAYADSEDEEKAQSEDAVSQAIQAIEEKAESGSEGNDDSASSDSTLVEAEDVSNTVYYEFRSESKFQGHYEKHGIEMGFSSPGEYLDAANALINNPEALHKYEEEDGDEVFFLESTNEIAFVSRDGYIRTYFICNGKDYFDRQ